MWSVCWKREQVRGWKKENDCSVKEGGREECSGVYRVLKGKRKRGEKEKGNKEMERGS